MDKLAPERESLREAEKLEKSGDINKALKTLEQCAFLLKKKIFDMSGPKKSQPLPLPLKLNNDPKYDYIELRSAILYEFLDFENAEEGFKTLVEEGPEPRKHFFCKAYADCLRKRLAYEESLEFYNKAYEGFKTSDNKSAFAAMLNNRGLTYIELEQYQNAQKDFSEASKFAQYRPRALYLCNEGQAHYLVGDRQTALKCFKEAHEIVKHRPEFEDRDDFHNFLRLDQANYIKSRFADFIKELDQLEQIKLKQPDEIMIAREKQYVLEVIKECNVAAKKEENASGKEEDKEKEKEWEQFVKILDSKQKLELIQDNALLYQYYDGFLYTLSQGYVVATVVNSGKLNVNTGNGAVSAVSTLVSLIPMVGSQVSEGINKVWDFVKDAQIKKAAVNVCSFATTVTEFESIAQEVAIDVILKKKAEIENLNPQTYLLPVWMQKFKNLIEKLNANIYGERNQTPMQKLGYQTASSLIAQFIASGQVYGDQPPICTLPKQKKRKLLEISLTLLNGSIDDSNKTLVNEDPKTEEKTKGEVVDRRSACCEMF